MLWMKSVTERMANHLVIEDPLVPRVGQPQDCVHPSGGLVDRLNGFSIHSRIMPHFDGSDEDHPY